MAPIIGRVAQHIGRHHQRAGVEQAGRRPEPSLRPRQNASKIAAKDAERGQREPARRHGPRRPSPRRARRRRARMRASAIAPPTMLCHSQETAKAGEQPEQSESVAADIERGERRRDQRRRRDDARTEIPEFARLWRRLGRRPTCERLSHEAVFALQSDRREAAEPAIALRIFVDRRLEIGPARNPANGPATNSNSA